MGFKILDASAFYAGVPFRSPDECHTTPLVYDEIMHIKKDHDALGMLIETNRLKINEPRTEFTQDAKKAARTTGDLEQMSEQDISVIALCIETGGEIVSDDFAVLNVARNIGLKTSSIMTNGIRNVGRWIYYCPGCGIHHNNRHSNIKKECPVCGTSLKAKLFKGK